MASDTSQLNSAYVYLCKLACTRTSEPLDVDEVTFIIVLCIKVNGHVWLMVNFSYERAPTHTFTSSSTGALVNKVLDL